MENLTEKRCLTPVLGANQGQAKSSLDTDGLSAPPCPSSCTNLGIAELLWPKGMG